MDTLDLLKYEAVSFYHALSGVLTIKDMCVGSRTDDWDLQGTVENWEGVTQPVVLALNKDRLTVKLDTRLGSYLCEDLDLRFVDLHPYPGGMPAA